MQILADDFPQLRLLCWNRPRGALLSGPEALSLYESSWRFVDQGALSQAERNLIDRLVAEHGNGAFMPS